MGFFPGMVKPAESGYDTYVVHVGDDGSYVVATLDKDGKTVDFTAGDDIEYMIADLARELSPNAEVRFHREGAGLAREMAGWVSGVFTFAQLAAVLNDLGSHPKSELVNATFCDLGDWRERYITCGDDDTWVLTDLARAHDLKHPAPEGK